MLNVIGCIAGQHDLRLVALAAAICIFACYTAIELAHQARAVQGWSRVVWILLAGLAAGSGIWATHFIAMLAHSTGLPAAYDVTPTVLSLVAAVLLTAAGLLTAIRTPGTVATTIGGAIVGAGVASMHFIGMAAYRTPATLEWRADLVALSVAVGVAGSAAALVFGLRERRFMRLGAGAMSLAFAICGLHFIAMAAVTVTADPSVAGPEAQDLGWLATTVAGVSLSIIFMALIAALMESRVRRRAERSRLVHSLANAAVEGILICEGDRIVTVNDSLAGLLGLDASRLVGGSLKALLPAFVPSSGTASYHARDLEVRGADGEPIPVEAIEHAIDVGGRPHRAVAIRDLRARRKAEAHIHFLAHHDALTGLANRASFNARLDLAIERALATGGSVAVLCLDLDRFKQFNDSKGHAAGDALLRRLAESIGERLGSDETLARLGGDEFAIIVGEERAGEVDELARDILDAALRVDAAVAGSAGVTTSIGVAVFPRDARDRENLLICADTALYRAKLEGRGDVRRYEVAMGVEAREKRELEADLRSAAERGEFHLVYQPQISIATRRIAGFEALIRWRHPRRGDVPPSRFIPIAEESDVISEIGEWVLEQACREAARWTTPLRIAVNVSAAQIQESDFPQRVLDILLRTGLDATRLELEITETALVSDLDRALAVLRRLKALGARIAMDDFGTGYSSLSNLRAFPFDRIKIDRSFISSVDSNEQGAAIVRAALALARALGLPVLAEGVETGAEFEFLKREGCQEAQGYLVGRPERIERLESMVRPSALAKGSTIGDHRAVSTPG